MVFDDTPSFRNPVRTLSGVTPLAVLTKPFPCPGKCAYCPNESGMPKSYLSHEPAASRAALTKFDPFAQVDYRIRQYRITVHPTDKVELIILGGTWSALPKAYQTAFIKQCLRRLNQDRPMSIRPSDSLKTLQKNNETAPHRLVGLTIETRPDYIDEHEIRRLRNLGVTRVELGVQSIDETVLRANVRGHGVAETIKATKLLKDAGFKVLYHLMPNLLGSTPEVDLAMCRTVFSHAAFMPDMLKIYPCLVTEGTQLHQWFKNGTYHPYGEEELVTLLSEIKKSVPPFMRIMRLYRDIPKEYIIAGSTASNMRQRVQEKLESEGFACKCIRCREIRTDKREKKLALARIDYAASFGTEIFLQFIDRNDRLYALLRLRIPSHDAPKLFRVFDHAALIRELHVFGPSAPFNTRGYVQHEGLGKKLIHEAERIADKDFHRKKMVIISGVGVRNYYKNMGYSLQQTYMVKNNALR